MAVVLVVGGKSEYSYFHAVLSKVHPWADLTSLGVSVAQAQGDSGIPELVDGLLKKGDKVVVLYDSDALERRGEQAAVIRSEAVLTHHLKTDFEGAFDSQILRRALETVSYDATADCLQAAVKGPRPFDRIRECAQATPSSQPLEKASLATALARVSERWWYVPQEFYPIAARLGNLVGAENQEKPAGVVGDPEALEARGRLYFGNHVANERVAYWDFDRREMISLPLPGKFDGRVTICRKGARAVTCRYIRDQRGTVEVTWVYVFDLEAGALQETGRFQLQGSAYELRADEDGNHLEFCIDRDGAKQGMRCLANGTQREMLAKVPDIDLYAARTSRSGRLTAAGPGPMNIAREGKEVTSLPHFYAHSFTWSSEGRYLAFFGRRWRKPPDFLWIHDLHDDRIHRITGDEHMMPIYWA